MAKYQVVIDKIRELFHEKEALIPLHAPLFIGNEKKYLNECIDTTYVSSVGMFVDRFELMVAGYTSAKHAIVCVNGTEALHLALLLAGVNAGDEVITQPLTFIATANAITYTGAVPVFVDVDMETLGLSPESVEMFLNEYGEIRNDGFCYNRNTGKRISACVPMHTFGHPVKLDELTAVCKKYNIPIIEDAAESIGSRYKGQHTGTFGRIGILSFNGNKTITTGGGGMLLIDDDDLAKLAKHLSTQAKVPHEWEFGHDQIGYNYRMPNINAALGCAQLEKLDFFIQQKRLLANEYYEFFMKQGISYFTEPKNCESNYWLNVILLENIQERDMFLRFSKDNNVMCRPIWKLMTHLNMYKQCHAGNLKNAEWLYERVVNIPSSVVI